MGAKGEDINITVLYLTMGFLLFALFLILFITIYRFRLNRHLKDKIKMKANFEQELLQTQLEIQEQTLKNISEEIHDNVGQVLSLAKLHLNTFPQNLDAPIQSKVDETNSLVSKAINDLRNLSRSLHGEKVTDIGLVEAIAGELNILQNTGQFATKLAVNGEQYKLDNQKEMVVFRIVQEALHNAQKHSKATELLVEINYTPGIFSLKVCDNGNGFTTETMDKKQQGIGLKNIHNRAALIGGKLQLESGNGKGTCINLELHQTENNQP
jgi:two-component system, NarL family, sensor kinase